MINWTCEEAVRQAAHCYSLSVWENCRKAVANYMLQSLVTAGTCNRMFWWRKKNLFRFLTHVRVTWNAVSIPEPLRLAPFYITEETSRVESRATHGLISQNKLSACAAHVIL